MRTRDTAREQLWLDKAELEAGRSGFAIHALRRLDAGDALYGDRWIEIGLEALVDELLEEAADLGSWGVLALEALEREQALEGPQRELIETTLRAAITWGAYSHHALALAHRYLKAGEDDCG